MSVSLADKVREAIVDDGFYVVHIMRVPDQPCPTCHAQEPSQNCLTCLGTGFRVRVQPILVRDNHWRRPLYDAIKETPLGQADGQERTYYCLPEVHVHENDLICLVTWNVEREFVLQHGRVVELQHVMRIEPVDPYYGEKSRIAFYRLGTHVQSVNTALIRRVLLARPLT